jgi:hypothetical protein
LSNQSVEIFVVRSLDAQVSSTDVVNSFVVDHETAVGMLEGSVGSQDGVIRLNYRGGDLRRWVDTELELDSLAILDRQPFHEKSSKSGAGTTPKGMEDQEALETRAIIGHAANFVKNLVDELLADRVMTAGIIVRSIFLASNHLFWVEQAAISASPHFVDHVRLEIAIDGSGNIFAVAC